MLIFTSVLFLGLCVGVTYYLYAKQHKDPVVYQTEAPFRTTIIKKTVATGSIEPRREVLIKSQVSGIVDKVFVKAGEAVKVGDLLAKIRIVPNVVSLSNAETSVKTARINFELSEQEYQRQEKLFNEKVIAQVDFQKASQDYKLKKEALDAAENNLQLIKKGSSNRQTQTSTLVRATIDGMLLDVPVKEGSYVIESNTFNEGTTIASVANMKDLIFKGKVVESEVGKIREGMDLNLTIGAIEGEVFKAKLEFISPKGLDDKGAIQFDIKATVQLKEGQFVRAGYSANADIILAQHNNVLALKEKNIEFKDGKAFIQVESDSQKFVKREIKTGLSDDINVEVLSGLKQNEKVKVL